MTLLSHGILVVYFTFSCNALRIDETLIVNTSFGPVAGFHFKWKGSDPNNDHSAEDTSMYGWRGVPFASPPINDLRWRSPVAPNNWTDPLDCSESKNYCIQPSGDGSEDCLYLNIYTNAHPTNPGPYPVLFYIYGGGLMGGSATGDFSGFALHAGHGKGIVVVEVAYRLNIFGFLASRELSEEQHGFSGNYGIEDQILALHWVQENIQNFNGDPSKVTISGQSSGGTSVFALMSSPLSKGLFHRAISMSGSPNITLSLSVAEKQNEKIIVASGCKKVSTNYSEVLNCMRSMDVKSLVALIPTSWNTPGIFGMPKGTSGENWVGLPVVDSKVIALPFDESLASGRLSDVPLMFGSMGQEPGSYADDDVSQYTIEEWQDFLLDKFKPWDTPTDKVGESINYLYAEESTINPQKAYDAIVSDYGIACATINITKRALPPIGKYSSSIYAYVNQWSLIYDQYRFAFHQLDYFMVTEQWSSVSDGFVPQANDLAGARFLQDLWYSFMVFGAPTYSLDFSISMNNQWKPINAVDEWPKEYSIFVIQSNGQGKSASKNIINYRANICSYYDNIGIGQKSFWWCN